jgi:surfactin family lipopeptide synthetase A
MVRAENHKPGAVSMQKAPPPILTDDERHRVLVEWNDTQKEYPGSVCIDELFAAQVERTPEAVAVVLEDEQLAH